MREILTISAPTWTSSSIKQIAKKRWFKSVSDYILYSVRQEQSMISEDDILKSAEIAENNYDKWNIHSGLDILKDIVW